MTADHKITIGNVEVTSVSDGMLSFPVGVFFPSVPVDAWEPYSHQLSQDARLELNIGSFLVRSDGRTLLVDTGLGRSPPEALDAHAQSGKLLDDLKARGIRREEIDMVVITHLHADHVGWNIDWTDVIPRPTFPRARYWIPKDDWEFFVPRARLRSLAYLRQQVNVLDELGLLELMEGEQHLTSEVSSLPTPGHTPGHTTIAIASQGERGLILGDAIHHPAQVQETEWSPRADTDPNLSRETRSGLVRGMERDQSLAISGHFPAPGFGRIVRLEGRRYWKAL